jgi:hypothetical protein
VPGFGSNIGWFQRPTSPARLNGSNVARFASPWVDFLSFPFFFLVVVLECTLLPSSLPVCVDWVVVAGRMKREETSDAALPFLPAANYDGFTCRLAIVRFAKVLGSKLYDLKLLKKKKKVEERQQACEATIRVRTCFAVSDENSG